MELWDLLDKDGNPLGIQHVRSGILPEGAYHRTVEIFTVNSQGQLLVTLRDPNKETYPDMWEFTGGSVISGEDSMNAAIRELQEETGIVRTADEMLFLMTNPGKTALMDIYLTFCDADVSELTMQAGETVEAKWVTFGEFEKMIDDGLVPEPVYRRYRAAKDLLASEIGTRGGIINHKS